MKTNKYTYIVPLDAEYHVIFNGITKKFITLKNEYVDSYVLVLKTPDRFVHTHKILIDKLVGTGFILENGFDEHEYLKTERSNYISSLEYKTSIIPTFECNYNCWYCIQKHQPAIFSEEKIALIIKHVKRYLVENKIQSYVLSWFGGEPLTQPDIIDHVTLELRDFCENHNIEFSAAVTTNGALLSHEVITMLQRRGVNYYQIAIDGDAVEHDKVKFDSKHESSFTLILNNIVDLLITNTNAHVTLRLNYTEKMLRSKRLVSDINTYIPSSLRCRLSVDLQKVWQIKEETVPMENLKLIQKELSDSGYYLSTNHVFSMCYVEKDHYNMIYYNGGVEKCDKRSIDVLRGYIDENGQIIWKEQPIINAYNLFADDCVCNNCQYYPLCYCGCPLLREERIIENGKVICGHFEDFSIFEQRIQDFCWRTIFNEKANL